MLSNNQPLEGAKTSVKPYRYTHCCQQSFTAWFRFVPKHTHRSSIGVVQFWLAIANRTYGPYSTDIRTTTTVWDGRKSLFASKQSKLVASLAGTFTQMLENGWAAYDQKGEPITGEMVLAKSGLKLVQGSGGPVYVV